MSKHITQLFLIILFVTLFGCKSSGEKEESKSELTPENTTVRELDVSAVLKPADMIFNDKYICLLNEEPSGGDQIFVFDADKLNFLYSFAKRGSGPEEILALDFVKTLREDTIDIIDQANYKKLTYELTNKGAKLVKSGYLELPNFGPLQETYWMNDSLMIFNTLDGDLVIYDDRNKKIVEQTNILDLVDGIPAEHVKKLGSFNFSVIGKEVFIGLRFFNEIFKLTVDDNYRFTIDKKPSVSLESIDMDNRLNNYNYYAYICTGKNLVLAQYYGRKLGDLKSFPQNVKGHNKEYDLIIYDSNLVPLRKFHPDSDMLRAFLDADRKRIYYWNPLEDFEQLKYITY